MKTPEPHASRFPAALGLSAAVAFALSPALAQRIDTSELRGFSKDDRESVMRNKSAIGAVLGEFRASMSDLIFIKTERYLDYGVAYKPHVSMDALSQGKDSRSGSPQQKPQEGYENGGEAHDHDHEGHDHDHEHEGHDHDHEHEGHDHDHESHDHDHEGHDHDHEDHDHQTADAGKGDPEATPERAPVAGGAHAHDHGEEDHAHKAGAIETIIRTSANDFRGFIGWLEREVKPYRGPNAPHVHSERTEELLPWYRVMTLSDPHSIRAYLIGAFWLRERGDEDKRKALEFLDEGIKLNPDAYQLHLARGYTLKEMTRDEEALRSFRQAADLAVAQRPPDAAELAEKGESLKWTIYQEEDALASVRMVVLVEARIGSKSEALRLARHYDQKVGGDPVLQRQIETLRKEVAPPGSEFLIN